MLLRILIVYVALNIRNVANNSNFHFHFHFRVIYIIANFMPSRGEEENNEKARDKENKNERDNN